jgi:hypothetical protein
MAELNRAAPKGYRRDDFRLELLYAAGARRQVLDMVRSEQTCCSFMTFEVHEEPDTLRVMVKAAGARPRRGEIPFRGSLFETLSHMVAGDAAKNQVLKEIHFFALGASNESRRCVGG